jgi:1,4-dihydroxy-2-naphthoate polyprenyltransferase
MSSVSAWISAARPRTLPLSMSGILVGLSLSPNQGMDAPSVSLGCILTTVLFQVLSNFANDLGDGQKGTDNANRIGPERAVQSGAISVHQMKRAVLVLSLLSLIAAVSLIVNAIGSLSQPSLIFYLILALLCILAAITYTVGKRAYGYSGFGDIMVFLFFGIVAVLGTRHLFNVAFSLNECLGAVAIGSWSTMVLNLNNMRDIQNDAENEKNTLAVKLGARRAKHYHYLLFILATSGWTILTIRLYQDTTLWLLFLMLLPLVPMFMHVLTVRKITQAPDFDPELKKVALSAFVAAVTCYIVSIISMP